MINYFLVNHFILSELDVVSFSTPMSEHFMLLSGDRINEDVDLIFQLDSTPAHTANSTTICFNDQGINVLDWPAIASPKPHRKIHRLLQVYQLSDISYINVLIHVYYWLLFPY